MGGNSSNGLTIGNAVTNATNDTTNNTVANNTVVNKVNTTSLNSIKTNTTSSTMPKTGQEDIFVVAGALVVLAGVAVVSYRKMKSYNVK